MMIIMETKINIDRAISFVSFSNSQIINLSLQRVSWWNYGYFGLWLVDFELNIMVINKRFIHCQVLDSVRHISWIGTSVYGYTLKIFKKVYGNKCSLPMIDSNPWLIIRDLNEIVRWKRFLNKGSSTRWVRFNKFVHDNSLTDSGYRGDKFTWYNQ